jgi:hypothetical protein
MAFMPRDSDAMLAASEITTRVEIAFCVFMLKKSGEDFEANEHYNENDNDHDGFENPSR